MKHRDSIDKAILERIQAAGPCIVHTPRDFLDLGSRAAVDQALSRNARAGRLHKAGRGLYEWPRHHRIWGHLPAAPEAVAEALARRDRLTLVPVPPPPGSGVTCQFLTDGRGRRIRHGKSLIVFRHASPRTLSAARENS